MKPTWDKRKIFVIEAIERAFWPLIRSIFQIKIVGSEHLSQISGPILFVSNHNSGALIESLTSLLVIRKNRMNIFGFTHPSLFKVPLFKTYFESLGAVPATYEVATEAFKQGSSLMIFPGGNSQALRPLVEYKTNHFRDSHGWAKIAVQNNVPVIPITFKNSHFVNPILLSGSWISKLLIIPWLLKLKVTSISIGQIVSAVLAYYLTMTATHNVPVSWVISYLVFILSPLTPIIPVPITMKIHKAILHSGQQDYLEDEVKKIMDEIYDS